MLRYIPNKVLELVVKILKSHSTTGDMADGLAIGVFIAFLPIMGIQMYVALGLASLFRKNPWVAMLAVWITNPITAVPIYWFNLWVGNLIYHKPVLFHELEHIVMSLDFHNILTAGKDILIPLWIGSVIVGVAGAVVSQLLCLRYYDGLKNKFMYVTHIIDAHLQKIKHDKKS